MSGTLKARLARLETEQARRTPAFQRTHLLSASPDEEAAKIAALVDAGTAKADDFFIVLVPVQPTKTGLGNL
jgi:alkanesulfonate monooxygenase SsuD/methylene tetrahydromethanopterin reductase-like flavin-dependent oxidoreductase (luciferase family)